MRRAGATRGRSGRLLFVTFMYDMSCLDSEEQKKSFKTKCPDGLSVTPLSTDNVNIAKAMPSSSDESLRNLTRQVVINNICM